MSWLLFGVYRNIVYVLTVVMSLQEYCMSWLLGVYRNIVYVVTVARSLQEYCICLDCCQEYTGILPMSWLLLGAKGILFMSSLLLGAYMNIVYVLTVVMSLQEYCLCIDCCWEFTGILSMSSLLLGAYMNIVYVLTVVRSLQEYCICLDCC